MSNNTNKKNKTFLRLSESSLRKLVREVILEFKTWEPPAALKKKTGGTAPDGYGMDTDDIYYGLGGYERQIAGGPRASGYDEDSDADGDDGDGDGDDGDEI